MPTPLARTYTTPVDKRCRTKVGRAQVERVLTIIKLAGEPVGYRYIAERLEASKSSTYIYIYHLLKLGMIYVAERKCIDGQRVKTCLYLPREKYQRVPPSPMPKRERKPHRKQPKKLVATEPFAMLTQLGRKP